MQAPPPFTQKWKWGTFVFERFEQSDKELFASKEKEERKNRTSHDVKPAGVESLLFGYTTKLVDLPYEPRAGAR